MRASEKQTESTKKNLFNEILLKNQELVSLSGAYYLFLCILLHGFFLHLHNGFIVKINYNQTSNYSRICDRHATVLEDV